MSVDIEGVVLSVDRLSLESCRHDGANRRLARSEDRVETGSAAAQPYTLSLAGVKENPQNGIVFRDLKMAESKSFETSQSFESSGAMCQKVFPNVKNFSHFSYETSFCRW